MLTEYLGVYNMTANEIYTITGHKPEEIATFEWVEVKDEQQEGGYFPPTTHLEAIFTLKNN